MPVALLLTSSELDPAVMEGLREPCQTISNILDETVRVAIASPGEQRRLDSQVDKPCCQPVQEVLPEGTVVRKPLAMAAAPFLYRADGRPDWGAMWGSFCELALYGGPPHRGADNPVAMPETDETYS